MSKPTSDAQPLDESSDATTNESSLPSEIKEEFRTAARELVKVQSRVIDKGLKILVVVEGRDGAGKDGAIRKVTKHMSPRETHVYALGKPTERDERAWYFERWVGVLPLAGEITFLNRSWYNRAGVEKVMGFCSKNEAEQFLETAPMFEHLLVHCGFRLIKYYLDVSKHEQKARLKSRRSDPLKHWKRSSVDDQAVELWDAYSDARDEMLTRTSLPDAPWVIVKADDKDLARVAIMRDLAVRLSSPGKKLPSPDPAVLRPFEPSLIKDEFLKH